MSSNTNVPRLVDSLDNLHAKPLSESAESVLEASNTESPVQIDNLKLMSLLHEGGFLDINGRLNREVVHQSDAYEKELDDRLDHDPEYAELSNLQLAFLKDVPKGNLKPGEQPVYPHHGESNDIARAAMKLLGDKEYDAVVECFVGAGHVGLKLRELKIVRDDAMHSGLEFNPRAIDLANVNAEMNDRKAEYMLGDVTKGDLIKLPSAQSKGRKLFAGNAPFALSPPKTELAVLRDGGEDGLEKTMAFVNSAVAIASPGDAVVGVAYSRIDENGAYEFESRLKELQANGANIQYRVELVEGAKLWRGYNGVKEQDNPMDLLEMTAKGEPGTQLYMKYARMAGAYKEEGWDQLAYVRYVIEVVEPRMDQVISSTRTKLTS